MTRNNRRRRVLHLVSKIVGRGPDEDDGRWSAYWTQGPSTVVEVMSCHECGGWWLAVHGGDFVELLGIRIPRRLRHRLAALHGGFRISESATPDSL